eukprot:m.22736 g.22736  ORF g.22736 m.22736 type:complete len:50 (+) comp28389_c0_seq5:313-462(+)
MQELMALSLDFLPSESFRLEMEREGWLERWLENKDVFLYPWLLEEGWQG